MTIRPSLTCVFAVGLASIAVTMSTASTAMADTGGGPRVSSATLPTVISSDGCTASFWPSDRSSRSGTFKHTWVVRLVRESQGPFRIRYDVRGQSENALLNVKVRSGRSENTTRVLSTEWDSFTASGEMQLPSGTTEFSVTLTTRASRRDPQKELDVEVSTLDLNLCPEAYN